MNVVEEIEQGVKILPMDDQYKVLAFVQLMAAGKAAPSSLVEDDEDLEWAAFENNAGNASD